MISTIPTVASADFFPSNPSQFTGGDIVTTVTLIILLIAKELVNSASQNSENPERFFAGSLSQVTDIGVLPLLLVFTSNVLVRIINIL